jgi:hypothetical protein
MPTTLPLYPKTVNAYMMAELRVWEFPKGTGAAKLRLMHMTMLPRCLQLPEILFH